MQTSCFHTVNFQDNEGISFCASHLVSGALSQQPRKLVEFVFLLNIILEGQHNFEHLADSEVIVL